MQPFVASDGLPLWDTFETSLFLVAGIAVGMVMGFLFPSLWRGFRRRLGRAFQATPYSLSAADLEAVPLVPPWLVESPGHIPNALPSQHPRAAGVGEVVDGEPPSQTITVAGDFVRARALGHAGEWRAAVAVLQSILRSPAASSEDIPRVYLELAQVYQQLGLLDRGLALAHEYQLRRPSSVRALELVTSLARKAHSLPDAIAGVERFKGNTQSPSAVRLMMSITHDFCNSCEAILKFSPFPMSPLTQGQTKDFERSFGSAHRLAPESLRLRQVRSLRSLFDAVLSCANRPEDLWVSFFAELMRLASVTTTHGILMTPGLPPLVAMLEQLAGQPMCAAKAIANARSIAVRDTAEGRNWALVSERQSWIAVILMLEWQRSTPGQWSNGSREAVAEAAFPSILSSLPPHVRPASQSTGDAHDQLVTSKSLDGIAASNAVAPRQRWPEIPCMASAQIAITSHTCTSCGKDQLGFGWTCVHCGAFESCRPAFVLARPTAKD